MKNTKYNNWLLRFFRYRSILRNKLFRKQFFWETGVLNYNRLKIVGYFAIVFSALQLLSDIFLGDFWDTYQINILMKLDTYLFLISLILLLVTYFRPVSDYTEIRSWHIAFVHIYIIMILLWASLVSIIEYSSSGSPTTYLISVFLVATIFFVKDIPMLIYYVSSLFLIYAGLYLSDFSTENIFTSHIPLFVLIVVAWIVSRVIFRTRFQSYSATKELERSKNNLNMLVKARTVELSDTNDKLINEIQERKRYEKKLEQERKKAEEADKLKTMFLANMSHEIRTPLNGIIGFGDLLRTQNLTSAKRDRYLDIIGNNSEQLLKIIDDIIDISMIESNQMKINSLKFNLGKIFPEALEFFRNYLQTNNKVQLKLINDGLISSADDIIFSDPSRIQQVLYNLISNAVKFTQHGYIRFGGKIDEGYALIYVEDTGIGINAEKCDTIFERFRQGEETVTRSYGGTGLGLSISKGLIELLGGMIWVDLSYTAGSRFCFSLPTEKAAGNISHSIIKKDISELEKRTIIITKHGGAYSGFMSHLMRCHKVKIPVYSLMNLDAGEIKAHPMIVFYDIPRADDEIFQRISTTAQAFKNSQIIAVSEGNKPLTDEKYNAAGCSMVIHAPVNLQVLLLHIHKLFSQNSKG